METIRTTKDNKYGPRLLIFQQPKIVDTPNTIIIDASSSRLTLLQNGTPPLPSVGPQEDAITLESFKNLPELKDNARLEMSFSDVMRGVIE